QIFCARPRGRPRLQHCTASVTLRHHAEGSPLPRREQWTRQGRSLESLTPRPGIREHYRSNSEVGGRNREVRFTPESRLKSDIAACRFRASFGHEGGVERASFHPCPKAR